MTSKKLLYIILFLSLHTSFYAQEITGTWSGKLEIQSTELTIVFNIFKEQKNYSATMDSPNQGAKNIPVTAIDFKDSILNISIVNIGIEFTGKLSSKDSIIGTFKQAGLSLPLNLSKLEVNKRIKPQTPIPPFPYNVEELVFENTEDEILLSGTLTIPKGIDDFPIVVLISGSGVQNRDSEIFGHRPFLVLSDYLSKNGIAVLRFDERGVGKSEGTFKTATTFDFAKDVISAVNYIKKRNDINYNRIGLVGHSEGGLTASIVASKLKEIDFIVLLASPAIRGDKLILSQQRAIGKVLGLEKLEIEKKQEINKKLFDLVVKIENDEVLKNEISKLLQEVLNDEEVKLNETDKENYVSNETEKLMSPWFRKFLTYEPKSTIKKLECNVLALSGSKDLQVLPKNIEILKKMIRPKKLLSTKIFPNLNHLFQECKTGLPNEYSEINQTFSPVVMNFITNWIKTNISD